VTVAAARQGRPARVALGHETPRVVGPRDPAHGPPLLRRARHPSSRLTAGGAPRRYGPPVVAREEGTGGQTRAADRRPRPVAGARRTAGSRRAGDRGDRSGVAPLYPGTGAADRLPGLVGRRGLRRPRPRGAARARAVLGPVGGRGRTRPRGVVHGRGVDVPGPAGRGGGPRPVGRGERRLRSSG